MANKPLPVARVFRKWELTDSSIAHHPYVEDRRGTNTALEQAVEKRQWYVK